MAIRLRRPDQPVYQQILFGIFEFLASLRLAVVLLGLGAIVLAWTTFSIEGRWGTAAAHFAVYHSWWFALLLGLLAVNVFASAAIRFPWKRYQTGFVLIHSGIVILLIGSLISRMHGIDAQLGVFEGRANNRAYEQQKIIRLAVSQDGADSDHGKQESQTTIIDVPFRCGPFNWNDYSELAYFPWHLALLDKGVLYKRDGILIEALNYYSDSTEQSIPRLVLETFEETPGSWDLLEGGGQEVVLDVHWPRDAAMGHRLFGVGSRKQLPTGQRIVFWMTGSQAEAEAFLRSAPKDPLGKKGTLVLYSGGKTTVVPLDDLTPGTKIPIEGTKLRAEFVSWDPNMLVAQLDIHSEKPRVERMLLFADFPELNRQDYVNGLFGTYWFDPHSDQPEVNPRMQARAAKPRLDILQTPEQSLLYRTWVNGAVETAASVAEGGGEETKIIAFKKEKRPLVARILEFAPSELPQERIQPLPFDPNNRAKTPRVQLRITVDDKTREKWISAVPINPLVNTATAEETLIVRGDGRTGSATFRSAELDLGFAVQLHAFNYKRDPGTNMPSHYSSLVDFVAPDNPKDVYEKNVLINLNEPADVRDPKTGRVYRLFQESFSGPWTPGQPGFEQLAGDDLSRERVFLSQFAVNYDPGRGVIYAGSLLIVLGIGIAFYMKAYFFKPTVRPTSRKEPTSPKEKTDEEPSHPDDDAKQSPLPKETE